MTKKSNTKRPDKIIQKDSPSGRPGKTGITGTYQSPPVAKRVYGSDYEKYTTKQGYDAYRKKSKKKKSLPLDKSKKKGSPRSYENLKKAKPVGKGKKGPS
jgi:hypothetical protein